MNKQKKQIILNNHASLYGIPEKHLQELED